MTTQRDKFNEKASHWRRMLDESWVTQILNSRWQQYLTANHMSHSATLAKADNSNKRTVGTLWFDGPPQEPSRANLGLERGFTNMMELYENVKEHPLAKSEAGENNLLILDGKVN